MIKGRIPFKTRFVWVATSVAVSIGVAIAGATTSRQAQIDAVPGQYVVELKKNASLYADGELERVLGGKIVSEVRPNMVVVQRAKNENPLHVANVLSQLADVQVAEPNFIFHAYQGPKDPDYAKLWGINNTGALDADGTRGLSGVDIGAEKAWERTTGSKDVIVAIIDTGIDYNHPDLKNNIWTNDAEANGQPGVDDDGNGYIDDIHGYNFIANTGDPLDDNGHGSHCAGTIGAEGDNGVGVAGVNWHVSLMAIKFLDGSGSGTLENAVKAIDYAAKSHARILSNSWGGRVVSDILEKAVGQTTATGQLFVAAAGNDAANNDSGGAVPATYHFDNVLAVAAVDNRGELASFSNYGPKSVHVAAPGVNILSTFKNGGYETYSGTSMATPHVSGVAALLLSAEPTLTYADLKDRLMKSSRPVHGLQGKLITPGIIDAYYALTGLTPPDDPNDPAVWTEQTAQAVASDHPYVDKAASTYTVHVPGAKRLSVHFSKFETENGYDKVQFLNASGESLGSFSGNKTGRFGPISDGDTMTLKFTSDTSVTGYGFDVDFVAVER